MIWAFKCELITLQKKSLNNASRPAFQYNHYGLTRNCFYLLALSFNFLANKDTFSFLVLHKYFSFLSSSTGLHIYPLLSSTISLQTSLSNPFLCVGRASSLYGVNKT